MNCAELMSKDPITCTTADDCTAAAKLMCEHDIGSLPVLGSEGGRKVVGMITDRDICCRVVAHGRQADRVKIGDAMSSNVVCCKEDDDVQEAIRLMQEHQIRRVAVVNQDGELCGMIAQADVARSQATQPFAAKVVQRVSEPVRHDAWTAPP